MSFKKSEKSDWMDGQSLLSSLSMAVRGDGRMFAYPPRSIYGFAGYDSSLCLPSQIDLRFCRVRFNTLLTLPDRFTILQGTIPDFAYPLISFYGFAGYDSPLCLPSQIDLRFCRVRFNTLLTLPDRFTVLQGTIRHFAYPPRSIYDFAGYDSTLCLPSDIVLRFYRVRVLPPFTKAAKPRSKKRFYPLALVENK